MIRTILLLGALSISSLAQQETIYEQNCIPCHRYQPASLEKMFMTYLKTYSGELSLKASLKEFLKNPNEKDSLMSAIFLDRFSVKDKSLLSDQELDEALNKYWELYNVQGKLK